MQNDLNFFAISKSGSSKGSGGASILLPVLAFLLIIGCAYGYITFVKMDTQNKINGINKQLLEPQYVKANNIIESMGSKNKFLDNYNKNILLASDKFKNFIFINSALYKTVLSTFPAGVQYSKFNIIGNKATLECTAANTLSTALFADNLKSKLIFASISYTDISKQLNNGATSTNRYTFNLAFTIDYTVVQTYAKNLVDTISKQITNATSISIENAPPVSFSGENGIFKYFYMKNNYFYKENDVVLSKEIEQKPILCKLSFATTETKSIIITSGIYINGLLVYKNDTEVKMNNLPATGITGEKTGSCIKYITNTKTS